MIFFQTSSARRLDHAGRRDRAGIDQRVHLGRAGVRFCSIAMIELKRAPVASTPMRFSIASSPAPG